MHDDVFGSSDISEVMQRILTEEKKNLRAAKKKPFSKSCVSDNVRMRIYSSYMNSFNLFFRCLMYMSSRNLE